MQKLSDWVHTFSKGLITLLVAVMVGVTLLEVASRNFFAHSFHWSDELARYSFIWLTFIGAAAVYKRNELVGFDLLLKKLPSKPRAIAFFLLQLVVIGFIIVLMYLGFKTTFSKTVMIQHSMGMGIPMFIPYISIPLGMIMMLIHAIASFTNQSKSKGGETE